MLTNKAILEKDITDVIKDIEVKANNILKDESDINLILNKIYNYTARKMSIKSKMILSSAYNNLSQQTLKKDIFQSPKNTAAFYSRDIGGELTKKFNFEITGKVNYVEAKNTIKILETSGVVVVVGTAVSVYIQNIAPFIVSAVIAGIIGIIIEKFPNNKNKEKCEQAIHEYLRGIKRQMIMWLDDIVRYYDKCVTEIETNLL